MWQQKGGLLFIWPEMTSDKNIKTPKKGEFSALDDNIWKHLDVDHRCTQSGGWALLPVVSHHYNCFHCLFIWSDLEVPTTCFRRVYLHAQPPHNPLCCSYLRIWSWFYQFSDDWGKNGWVIVCLVLHVLVAAKGHLANPTWGEYKETVPCRRMSFCSHTVYPWFL